MKTDEHRAVACTSLVLRWTPEQIENAHRIVNDIAEDIDGKDTYAELRTSLAIYADLLSDERERRNTINSDEMLDHVKRISAHLETQNASALAVANPSPAQHDQ